MNGNGDTQSKQPLKPGIILDADEDKGEVSVGVDLDGDGKADFSKKFTVKDPTVWAAIGWIIAGLSIAKHLGIW